MPDYSFGKSVDLRFDAAIERIASALVREGFGIVGDIDVSRRMKAKLGVEMPRYRILAACHPLMATEALTAEPELGTMFPCNVVIRETREGLTRIDVVDPLAILGLSDNERVRDVANALRERMQGALATI